VSGAVASWPEQWGVLSTARALNTLVELFPEDPLIPKAIRFLMLARRGDMWYSTRDTAEALIGLTQYLRRTNELAGNYRLEVKLNGQTLKTMQINRSNILDETKPIVIPISKLPDGDSRIEITKDGSGVGYYSLEVHQTPEAAHIGALVNESGLSVRRTYHTLAARPMEDGTLRLMPSTKPVASFNSGEPVRCKITLHCDRTYQFVMIDAPTPANMRVTESEYLEEWNWWFSGMSILEDRVVFFARYLEKGDHTIEYTLRAEAPGTASALPAVSYEMYAPDTRGSSAEDILQVNGK
jgi:hypothetical protein